MLKGLASKINSDLIQAFNALNPKNNPKTIKVYVESDYDITHWNKILDRFNLKNVVFDISLPNKTHYEKGKGNIFKNFKNSLGPNLIVCVDSDYDYLIPEANEDSVIINTSDFVFQTFSYSIENLYCFHESLQQFCFSCLNKTNLKIDIASIINRYSLLIYDILVWNIYLYSIGMAERFSRKDFTNICNIKIFDDFDNHFHSSFTCLSDRVKDYLNPLLIEFKEHKDKIDKFKVYLESKGLLPDNCYLFAQGHLILEDVVLKFIKTIVLNEKKIKIKEIKDKCKDVKQTSDEIRAYNARIVENGMLINYIYRNPDFHNSDLYQKTENQINNFISKYELN
ncbi:DUF4435 domain-containing protein [Sphingobacterium psychroaquaticum]|uniref:DUF4435 domain-containing protein n=1 Tax=Sphingobacterium psychroaquaticum TaxID=561061 RepID=A0A1X7JW16_9SPHI|nr:DUF4435 domain-containing protein [Sphingobacterium psychroaquaticum]SMG32433.1 Protein of unknown function [Sphingobacterium psychroaquaticum]